MGFIGLMVNVEIRAIEILRDGDFGSKFEHIGYASGLHDRESRATDQMLRKIRTGSRDWRDWHSGWLAAIIEQEGDA